MVWQGEQRASPLCSLFWPWPFLFFGFLTLHTSNQLLHSSPLMPPGAHKIGQMPMFGEPWRLTLKQNKKKHRLVVVLPWLRVIALATKRWRNNRNLRAMSTWGTCELSVKPRNINWYQSWKPHRSIREYNYHNMFGCWSISIGSTTEEKDADETSWKRWSRDFGKWQPLDGMGLLKLKRRAGGREMPYLWTHGGLF